MHDHQIKMVLIDVREDADYNLFHLANARHVGMQDIQGIVEELHPEPANTIEFLMSNNDSLATEACKIFIAGGVPNVYILEGGVSNWLAMFADDAAGIRASPEQGEDVLRYSFVSVLRADYECAPPDLELFELEFEPRLMLEYKRGPAGGGCGQEGAGLV